MTQQPSRAGTFGAILRVTSGNFLEQFDFFCLVFMPPISQRRFFPPKVSSPASCLLLPFLAPAF